MIQNSDAKWTYQARAWDRSGLGFKRNEKRERGGDGGFYRGDGVQEGVGFARGWRRSTARGRQAPLGLLDGGRR
jgi:hypothetical protein